MADDFGKEVRELLDYAEDFDKENRREAFIDLDFEGFNQWDPRIRQWRENYVDGNNNSQPLPCFTINTAQQYTGQVVGDWLTNETSIKVLPREDGDVTVADVRSELIRSIELQSKADRVYASSLGQMVACGSSAFRVDVENAYEDAFAKDIFINDIPDPLAVRWDPLANDATGRDATFCFVGESVKTSEYERRFPKAALPSLIEKEAGAPWSDGEIVMLPEYWKIDERPAIFGMTADGKTLDLTDIPKNKWPKLAIDMDTKQPIVNDKAKCKYAVMVMTNGLEQLTDPYELKLPRLPIIRVMGREVRTEKGRVRFGIIRALRDSQRYKNYIRSVRAEMLMRAPRVNFTAAAQSIVGRESDWDNTLVYNDGSPEPKQVTAANLAELLNEEALFAQDMKDVTGIHEASQGMPSNETSGVAITNRQREGDIATVIYHHHMTAAQQEAGEVINALIPVVYDTARTIRTVGPDLSVKMVRVNDPEMQSDGQLDPTKYVIPGKYEDGSQNPAYEKASAKYKNIGAAVPDLGIGHYDVTISTAPTYATRRQEGAAQLMELARIAPQIAEVAPDVIVGEMDLVNGDKLVERLKRTVPPQILGDDAQDGMDPQEIAQQQQKVQQAQQMQAMQMQMSFQTAQAELALKQGQAAEAQAKAELAQAQALKAKTEAMSAISGQPDPAVDAETQRTAIMGYNAETQRLATLMKGDMPGTPPLLSQHLAPIIANAVGQALAKHLGFAPVELGLPTVPPLAPVDNTAADQGAPQTTAPDQGLAA